MTLMETLTAAMIFVVIFMLTYGIFDSGSRLMSATDASANNQLEVRQALMDMERTIRGGTDVNAVFRSYKDIPLLVGRTELLFTLNGVDYHYYITKEDFNDESSLYQLRELSDSGGDRIVADNVVSCIFDLDQPLDSKKKVLITITVRETTSTKQDVDFTLNQRVTLRNADGSPCSRMKSLTGIPPTGAMHDIS